MKLKELIEKFEERKTIIGNYQGYAVWWEDVKEIFEQLDEPETGHADEAPRYLKNILARLRELPLHNREVWLKVIMSEFKQDFSHAKWREGYEQGKLEGAWVGNQLKDADKIRNRGGGVMSYECSNCGKELEDEFLVVQENHVILALFNDVENCFCSQECVNDFLMIESKYLSNGDIPYDEEEVE